MSVGVCVCVCVKVCVFGSVNIKHMGPFIKL